LVIRGSKETPTLTIPNIINDKFTLKAVAHYGYDWLSLHEIQFV